MIRYGIAFSIWLLFVAVACYFTFNSSGKELLLVKQHPDLTIEEATEKTDHHLIELSNIPFDYESTINIYDYRYGSAQLQKTVMLNYNEDDNKGINIIISPSSVNLQDEETIVATKDDAKVELEDGSIAYYFEKDLGERIVFEKDGLTYGIYHLTQSEDSYGEEEMITIANEVFHQ